MTIQHMPAFTRVDSMVSVMRGVTFHQHEMKVQFDAIMRQLMTLPQEGVPFQNYSVRKVTLYLLGIPDGALAVFLRSLCFPCLPNMKALTLSFCEDCTASLGDIPSKLTSLHLIKQTKDGPPLSKFAEALINSQAETLESLKLNNFIYFHTILDNGGHFRNLKKLSGIELSHLPLKMLSQNCPVLEDLKVNIRYLHFAMKMLLERFFNSDVLGR